MTCYLRDPRPLPGGHATINIWVVPLGEYDDPTLRLLRCVPGAQAALVSVSIPDSDWLTSNMRESDAVRKRKQTAIMRRAAKAWGNKAMGAHMGVICNVGYPDPHYLGDPDNTAESLTAVLGAGVALDLMPAVPQIVAFRIDPRGSEPHTHDLNLLCFTCPPDMFWPQALLG